MIFPMRTRVACPAPFTFVLCTFVSSPMAMAMANGCFRPADLRLPSNTTSEQLAAIPLVHLSNYKWNKEAGSLVPVDEKETGVPTLQLVPEALELLKTINKKVAVLAVCGPYRSGKSFFISRVLDKPGTFKLGHSMEACTRGIWLSTTALECEEFVLLVLDTEGIGAVEGEGPESFTTKLLVATILLSSFLIYNSMNVPGLGDLQNMSSFAHLSTAIAVTEKGQANNPNELQEYFPQFMWLLRDVAREEGDPPLIDHLNSEVLKPTGQKDYDSIITAIRTLFPQPLQCVSLPSPSLESGEALEDEENVDEYFKEEADKLINGEGGIKASVEPKVGFEGIEVTGVVLAELAEAYVAALNKKGSVPSLEGAWRAVMELKLAEEVEKSVSSYEEEMKEEVAEKLPMEHSIPEEDSDKLSLIGCHWRVFNAKQQELGSKMRQILPQPRPDDPPAEEGTLYKSMMGKLEKAIVEEGEGGIDTMEGIKSGKLLQFATDNNKESEKQCEKVWNELLEKHKVMDRTAKALNQYDSEEAVKLCESIEILQEDYKMSAVGPARDKVYSRRNESLEDTKKTLQCIPGPPQNVQVVGKATDRIKLQWKKPVIHPDAAKKYIVMFRLENKKWEEVEVTPEQWCIVRNLKTNTKYEFKVASWNDEAHKAQKEIESLVKGKGLKSGTRLGRLARAALSAVGFINGTFMAPIISGPGAAAEAKDSKNKLKAIGIVASIPLLATLGAPVTGAIVAYKVVKNTSDWGDLEEGYIEEEDNANSTNTNGTTETANA